MKYVAVANVKSKIVVAATLKQAVKASVSFPILAPSCPQYSLIDGGTPSWIYVPIGSFDLVSGGTP